MAKGDKFYFENFIECASLAKDASAYLVECLENYDRLMEVRRLLVTGFVVPEHLGFEFCGQWVQNPFYDVTHRFGVDPVAYYGRENVWTFAAQVIEAARGVDDVLLDAKQRSEVSSGVTGRTEDFVKD